jgi:hypothetical protein
VQKRGIGERGRWEREGKMGMGGKEEVDGEERER